MSNNNPFLSRFNKNFWNHSRMILGGSQLTSKMFTFSWIHFNWCLQKKALILNFNKPFDLIPNCLLLHLEAGRNLEAFIASTFGYRPSSSTDWLNLTMLIVSTKPCFRHSVSKKILILLKCCQRDKVSPHPLVVWYDSNIMTFICTINH